MCGIFGIIGLKARVSAEVPAEVLQRATQSLTHRGPDDGGTVILQDSARRAVEKKWEQSRIDHGRRHGLADRRRISITPGIRRGSTCWPVARVAGETTPLLFTARWR